MFDFNHDQEQKIMGGLIPDETCAFVMTLIRGGGHGPGGWMTKKEHTASLDFVFTVVGGEFDGRKFWKELMMEGDGSDKHNTAVNISRGQLRGMLEGAYGIDPKATTPEAAKVRAVEGFHAFSLLKVPCLIGLELGGPKDKSNPKGEQWPDKNKPKLFVTPGHELYVNPGEQGPRPDAQAVVAPRQPSGGGGGSDWGGQGSPAHPNAPQAANSQGAAKPAWAA